jgi:hypothetical protein
MVKIKTKYVELALVSPINIYYYRVIFFYSVTPASGPTASWLRKTNGIKCNFMQYEAVRLEARVAL